jgi:hypothetical protein
VWEVVQEPPGAITIPMASGVLSFTVAVKVHPAMPLTVAVPVMVAVFPSAATDIPDTDVLERVTPAPGDAYLSQLLPREAALTFRVKPRIVPILPPP